MGFIGECVLRIQKQRLKNNNPKIKYNVGNNLIQYMYIYIYINIYICMSYLN